MWRLNNAAALRKRVGIMRRNTTSYGRLINTPQLCMRPVLRSSSFSRKTLLLVPSPTLSPFPSPNVPFRSAVSRVVIRGWSLVLLIVVGALLWARPAHAQDAPPLSRQAEATMLTILPGDAIYSEFGHSAIRIHDPVRGIDVLYSYGTFDFSDPMFVPKFTYGQLDYFLSTQRYAPMIDAYKRMERPVIEQYLDLTPRQVQHLFQFLYDNAKPENRGYRYDFLFDNCSTRVRGALEDALGPAVSFSGSPDPQQSFRHLLDPYVADRPLTDVGFDVGLGLPSDQIASSREVMFLPEYLFWAFENATIRPETGDAGSKPLVARTDTLFWVDEYDARESAFPWPLALTWLVAVAGVVLTVRRLRQPPGEPPSRRWDAVFFGIAGVVGLIISFLWFISEHLVTNANMNLLWAWPTHLILAVHLLRHPLPTSASSWTARYLLASAVVTGILTAGWFVWPQSLHAAIFPLALLLTLRSGALWVETARAAEGELERA
jgi:hypothetical protein